MPEITLDGTPRDPRDVRWVLATMLFPNDETLRRQYFGIDSARYKVLECNDTDRLEINASDLRLLIEAPAYDVLKDITAANTKCATVAGDILMVLYIMDKFNVPEPSLNKAIFVAMEYAKNAKYGDGTRMNVSERMVLKCWNEYKPVAHLWAAFRINVAYPYTKDGVFSDPKFLEVAVGLFRFGAAFIPARAKIKNPVIDAAKCWTLPDRIPASNLVSERRPDRLLKYLKKYKAPKSSM